MICHYRSSTNLIVSAVSLVVTCVCLGGRAADATGPSKHRLSACLHSIPLRGMVLCGADQAVTDLCKLPGIVKRMVEFAEIHFKLEASVNYRETSVQSRAFFPKMGP